MKTNNAVEKITAQDSRNNQSNVSKYSADDYRDRMVMEWYEKRSNYDRESLRDLKGTQLEAFLAKRDAQLEAFLKSKGVKGRKCSITKKVFYGWDNNAYPFKGRCSNEANSFYVIPARMLGVSPELIQRYGGNYKFACLLDEYYGRK